ncbi:cytochrome-c peroxidase [Hyphobacterium marinum]|uniref:Cytochrome c peroxidase n=1 Tax=Hyphobacterium marinum TaxID=3116574 RepID=A0ABU7LV21_9PROT|nr:cytochrome c peroxidase [Hyphobacterium sp. Y6023]MEE2565336.1 cytochrome c peroxidase [Hyphobacterium sp. Y6023]
MGLQDCVRQAGTGLAFAFLFITAPSDGQAGPIPFAPGAPVWTVSADGRATDLRTAEFRPGDAASVVIGSHRDAVAISRADYGLLGQHILTASGIGSETGVLLVSGGMGAFGRVTGDAGTGYLAPDGAGGSVWLEASSLRARDLAAEERQVVSAARRLLGEEAGPVTLEARLSPAFVRRHGLAAQLRAQYLAEVVNSELAETGSDRRVTLGAVRETPDGGEPGIAFATLDTMSAEIIVAAVLPNSRAVQVGDTATAFATIINAGAETATSCGLQLTGADPAGTFSFQTTDAANTPVGAVNGTVDIGPGAAQSFLFAFTPSAVFEPGGNLPLEFACTNQASAAITPGVNTLWFSASAAAVPDIIAISEVGAGSGLNTTAGVVDIIDRQRNGAFVVATTNVGVSGEITVSAAPTNEALPVSVRVCQTNPGTGACLATPTDSVSLTIGPGATPTFAFFAIGDIPVAFAPATNRIQVSFREGAALRGSTTVAVRTLMSEPVLPDISFLYSDSDVTLPAHFRNGPVAAADNTPIDNAITNAGATLGRVLFYDRRLSANNTVSCASCHTQATGFSEGAQFSAGFAGELTGRHSPGLSNARYYDNGRFFWDERAATLEDQVLAPIQSEVEMGLTLEEAVARVAAEDFYGALFQAAFGDPEVTSERMSLAMAQFVRAMTSANSRFDQALADGPLGSAAFEANFTAEEFLGLQLFMPVPGSAIDDVGCGACHNTLAHISDAVHNIGLENPPVDDGAGNGAFKAPSLRNVAVRTHFMHDGRFSSLAEVIEHYNSGVVGSPDLDPRLRQGPGQPLRLNLTDDEKAALEAFLHTLTDNSFLTDPRFSDPFVD